MKIKPPNEKEMIREVIEKATLAFIVLVVLMVITGLLLVYFL